MMPDHKPTQAPETVNQDASAAFGADSREAAKKERGAAGPQKISPSHLDKNLAAVVDAVMAESGAAKVSPDSPLRVSGEKRHGQWREGELTVATSSELLYKGQPLTVGHLTLKMDGNNVARFSGGAQHNTAERSEVEIHFALAPGADAKTVVASLQRAFRLNGNGVHAAQGQTISDSPIVAELLNNTDLINIGGKNFLIGASGRQPLPLSRMNIGNASAPLSNVVIDNVQLRDVRIHGALENVTMARVNGTGINLDNVKIGRDVRFNGGRLPEGMLDVQNGAALLNQALLPGIPNKDDGRQAQPKQKPAGERQEHEKKPRHEEGDRRPQRRDERPSNDRRDQRRGNDHGQRRGGDQRERFTPDIGKPVKEPAPVKREPFQIPYANERDRTGDYKVFEQEITTYEDGVRKGHAPLIGQFKKMSVSVSADNQHATIDLVMNGSNFSPRGQFAKHAGKDAVFRLDLDISKMKDLDAAHAFLSEMVKNFQSGRDGVIEGKSITTAKLFRDIFRREDVKIEGFSGENFYIAAHEPLKGRRTDPSSPTGLLGLGKTVIGSAGVMMRNVVMDRVKIDQAHILGKLENVHIVNSSARLSKFDGVVAVRGTTINESDLFGATLTGKFDLRDFTGNHIGKAELPADMKVKTREPLPEKDKIYRDIAALPRDSQNALMKVVDMALKLFTAPRPKNEPAPKPADPAQGGEAAQA